MRLSQVRKWITGLWIGVPIVGVIGGYLLENAVVLALAIMLALMAADIFLTVKYWRCPDCMDQLPYRQHFYDLTYCLCCGKKLDLE